MWAKRVDAYRKSGQTIPKFCQENGIKTSTLKYWMYKSNPKETLAVKKPPVACKSDAMWLDLPIKSEPTSITLTVGDVQIKVETGFDQVLLKEIIKTVGIC